MLFVVIRCQKSYHHIPKRGIFIFFFTLLRLMSWATAKGVQQNRGNCLFIFFFQISIMQYLHYISKFTICMIFFFLTMNGKFCFVTYFCIVVWLILRDNFSSVRIFYLFELCSRVISRCILYQNYQMRILKFSILFLLFPSSPGSILRNFHSIKNDRSGLKYNLANGSNIYIQILVFFLGIQVHNKSKKRKIFYMKAHSL